MTARNDITGDALSTGSTSDAYRDGWDRIFSKKHEPEPPKDDTPGPVAMSILWWKYLDQHPELKGNITFQEFRTNVYPTLKDAT